MSNDRVLKYGVGYHLIVREEVLPSSLARLRGNRLYLGIHCLTCQRTSFNVTDVDQRFCGHCKVFHDDARPADA